MKSFKILAIDPGIKKIGWAIGKAEKNFKILDFNCLKTSQKDFLFILNFFENLVKKYRPKILVLEKIIFSKNKKTAIEIAKVIGILELLAQKYQLEVIEISPKELKKMITGNGTASKKEIRKFLELSLEKNLKDFPSDALDAISLSLAGFYLTKQKILLKSC